MDDFLVVNGLRFTKAEAAEAYRDEAERRGEAGDRKFYSWAQYVDDVRNARVPLPLPARGSTPPQFRMPSDPMKVGGKYLAPDLSAGSGAILQPAVGQAYADYQKLTNRPHGIPWQEFEADAQAGKVRFSPEAWKQLGQELPEQASPTWRRQQQREGVRDVEYDAKEAQRAAYDLVRRAAEEVKKQLSEAAERIKQLIKESEKAEKEAIAGGKRDLDELRRRRNATAKAIQQADDDRMKAMRAANRRQLKAQAAQARKDQQDADRAARNQSIARSALLARIAYRGGPIAGRAAHAARNARLANAAFGGGSLGQSVAMGFVGAEVVRAIYDAARSARQHTEEVTASNRQYAAIRPQLAQDYLQLDVEELRRWMRRGEALEPGARHLVDVTRGMRDAWEGFDRNMEGARQQGAIFSGGFATELGNALSTLTESARRTADAMGLLNPALAEFLGKLTASGILGIGSGTGLGGAGAGLAAGQGAANALIDFLAQNVFGGAPAQGNNRPAGNPAGPWGDVFQNPQAVLPRNGGAMNPAVPVPLMPWFGGPVNQP